VNTPKYKFNYGEIYNLSIGRGTLTEEERYIINAHMIQTIKMLDELPFPRHLRAVPEIAGGHHEKMDGTGYPKKLQKDDMSTLARIMSIADVFEALTAVDRPYKKGKTLSEAIKIMQSMKKEHHLDGDLFDLFLASGVYQEYANKYMRPYQIDEVNIESFINQ
jgi:HD-GYP domain-containing protein (c-di-GMP phosphodiesterase class II)